MSKSLAPLQAENLRGHLRELMRRKGWDQKDAGDHLGVTQQTISNILGARSNGSFPFAVAVAKGLGRPVDELLSQPADSELMDPYPNRAAVLSFLRDEVDEELATRVGQIQVGEEDRPRLWWCQRVALERDALLMDRSATTPSRAAFRAQSKQ